MLDKIKDNKDVGDETQQNFRYQHAYGVIILLGAHVGNLPYTSIWCEHHDDILCERNDGRFDVFQIKTRGNSQGEWLISSKAIQSSLNKFCKLHEEYDSHIGKYCFVSNMSFREVAEDIKNENRLKKSPINFLNAIKASDTIEELNEPYKSQLDVLSESIEQNPTLLFEVLKITELIKGPSKDDFETVLSHQHVGNLPECASFPKAKLNRIKDVLIAKVYSSSALTKDGNSMYWYYLNSEKLDDPELISKRINKDFVENIISDEAELDFQFIAQADPLLIPQKERKPTKIQVKMERGLLGDVVETMTRRALSAEQHLIKLGFKNSNDDFNLLLNHLSSTVKAECDDARIKSVEGKNVDGRKMYSYVVDSLKELANNHPKKVRGQDQNVLLGIAGLLTDECKVWWSEKFNIEDK